MKLRPLASTLLTLLLFCATTALAADLTPDQSEQVKLKSGKWGIERQKATVLTKAAKYQEAEAIYKKIIGERQALDLDLSAEYDLLGQLYLSWGKKDEAEKIFQEMVAAREKMSGADSQDVVYPLKEYADCLDKVGKKAEGKKVRARAAAIQKDLDTIPKFGKISMAAGSPQRLEEADKIRTLGEKCMKEDLQLKALAYFDQAVALHPKDAQALRDRGEARQWFDKWNDSLSDLNKAIEIKPDFEKAYVSRGFLHDNRKEYALAMADFEKAVTLDPKDTDTLGTLAKHLEEKGNHKQAVEYYGKIIAVNPALYWPYVQRAEAYSAMGEYKLAEADLTTLLGRAPEDSDYYEYRAAVYVKAGDFQKALDDYNHLITLNPKYASGYHARANVYEKVDGKKSPRAIADYATAKKLGY